MKHFTVGGLYAVKLSSGKRYGEQVGICEVNAVTEIPHSELDWKATGIRDCYTAIAGEITVILKTQTTNEKPKRFPLIILKNSEAWQKEYNTKPEEYWFSPGKRNYQTISAE